MSSDILNEQIAYYRARAREYDETVYQIGQAASDEQTADEQTANLDQARIRLEALEPVQHALELACGTGMWTTSLLKIAQRVTALDASPEMLEIARSKVGDARVSYQQADLFTWEPAQQYDLVFFAFWLSHVPPERLDDFFARVQRAVRPGGQLFIVDQYAPLPDDLLLPQEDIQHTRTLRDGRAFKIIKVFHDLQALEEKLARLDFTAATQKHGDVFFSLVGTRSEAR
jgi:ubiquinone/menaquinone biosynthesis C-methylase UbiE